MSGAVAGSSPPQNLDLRVLQLQRAGCLFRRHAERESGFETNFGRFAVRGLYVARNTWCVVESDPGRRHGRYVRDKSNPPGD